MEHSEHQNCILLVEDDQISQQVEEWKLRKLGYQLHTASSTWEALDILRSNTCDIVLVSCHLLEMDGLQIAFTIRSAEPTTFNPHIPILAMTAEPGEAALEFCLTAGINDLLSKPVRSEELAEKLEFWLNWSMQKRYKSIASTSSDSRGPGGDYAALGIFNEAELLDRLMDDRRLEKLIVEAFLKEMPVQIKVLKQHILNRDTVNAQLLAQSMRGASANLAAHFLREVLLQAEVMAKIADFDGLTACISRIEREFALFAQEIKKNDWMADKGATK